VVPTTTRQFLWRLWHRKLYFGEKRGAEQVPCSFAGLEGASCTAYMSVAHLTSECPTVALCLAYFERCWFEWCGTRTTRDHIQEFTAPDDCRSRDQWRWSLALLLHMLWRSRCCGHLAVPRKKVTAMVVIKAWQGELALQLRLAFLGRSFPDLWRVRGGWARMVDDRVRVQGSKVRPAGGAATGSRELVSRPSFTFSGAQRRSRPPVASTPDHGACDHQHGDAAVPATPRASGASPDPQQRAYLVDPEEGGPREHISAYRGCAPCARLWAPGPCSWERDVGRSLRGLGQGARRGFGLDDRDTRARARPRLGALHPSPFLLLPSLAAPFSRFAAIRIIIR
jgi:hypothetical protein